ncbi:MAG: hypothetical protein K0R65_1922 [Crocinitomicaceae bacterium]|jgi:hypothetical protein|nr:hypothetical protein [Crocinitomicaceae bacterium]
MKNNLYPLQLEFKIGTLANDFSITDASGRGIAYVRQKMFKFIDDISVFSDENRNDLIYRIKANKWIDFSASYQFTDNVDYEIGRVARRGMASLWRAKYEVFNKEQVNDFLVQEENAWAKVGDTLFGEIPILGLLTGYLFHPKYAVKRVSDGTIVARLKKEPSFFGRKFSVEKLAEITENEEERILLSLMMMILLERRRG